MEERVIGSEISEFDERFEQSLRPQYLSQYIGQQKVKHNLEMRDYIDSNREVSPLRMAEDAILLDNTNLSMEEQLDFALKLVAKKL